MYSLLETKLPRDYICIIDQYSVVEIIVALIQRMPTLIIVKMVIAKRVGSEAGMGCTAIHLDKRI